MILARIANFDKATHRFVSRLCDFVFFAVPYIPLCTPLFNTCEGNRTRSCRSKRMRSREISLN